MLWWSSFCSVSIVPQSCYQKDDSTFLTSHVFFEIDVSCRSCPDHLLISYFYRAECRWLQFTIDLLGILTNNQATKKLHIPHQFLKLLFSRGEIFLNSHSRNNLIDLSASIIPCPQEPVTEIDSIPTSAPFLSCSTQRTLSGTGLN